MRKGFRNKENLKNALESSDFLKEINMTSYDDIKDRENKDSIILREQMYENENYKNEQTLHIQSK